MNKKIKAGLITLTVLTVIITGGVSYNNSKIITTFNDNIHNIKNNFSKLIINDSVTEYENLINQYENALNSKNLSKVKKLNQKLNELEQDILNKNKVEIEKKIAEISKLELTEDIKTIVNEKLSNIKILVINKDFILANEKIIDIEKYIEENSNKNSNLSDQTNNKPNNKPNTTPSEKTQDTFNINKITGYYEYAEKNPNGFILNSVDLYIEHSNERDISVSGSSNYFQSGKLLVDGEFIDIDKNEITLEMVEKQNTGEFSLLARGSSFSGNLTYTGNNTFEGKIYDDSISKENTGFIKINGNKINFTLGNQTWTLIKK